MLDRIPRAGFDRCIQRLLQIIDDALRRDIPVIDREHVVYEGQVPLGCRILHGGNFDEIGAIWAELFLPGLGISAWAAIHSAMAASASSVRMSSMTTSLRASMLAIVARMGAISCRSFLQLLHSPFLRGREARVKNLRTAAPRPFGVRSCSLMFPVQYNHAVNQSTPANMNTALGMLVVLVLVVAGFIWLRSKKPAATVIPNTPVKGIDFSGQLKAAQAAAKAYYTWMLDTDASVQVMIQMPMYTTVFGVPAPKSVTNTQAEEAQANLKTAWGSFMKTVTTYTNTLVSWTPKTDISTVMGASRLAVTLKADSMKYIGQVQGFLSTIYNYVEALWSQYQSTGNENSLMSGPMMSMTHMVESLYSAIMSTISKKLPATLATATDTGNQLAMAATSI